ncbi:MAG TPA: SMR family transporter [Stellaceae bacterium]|nr:SMR family transporter [Stellaceae bacterium]
MAAARYFVLAFAIALGVAGQVCLKTGAESPSFAGQFLSPWSIIGLGCYALAAFSYMVSIRYIPLSIAYPSVALGYIVVAAIAHVLWREELNAVNLGGMGLIVVGVALLHIRFA